FSMNKSDAITSVSENLKEDILRLFNVKKEVSVIPNFIDLDRHSKRRLNNDCYRSRMAKEDERIITHISNLRQVKRLVDVIEVFDRIQKELPAKLIIIGEGPDKL